MVSITVIAAAQQPTAGIATAPPDDDDVYARTAAICDRQRPFLRRLNGLAIAQSVVGVAATVLCARSQ